MAQAAVDLPDPKQRPGSTSPATAHPTNVDDLLAQLAGEEIDRLLAEAESGRTPASEESPRSESPAAFVPSPVRVTQSTSTLDPFAKAASDPVDEAMSAQLDELFDQLDSQKASAVTLPEPTAAVAARIAPPTTASEVPSTAVPVAMPAADATPVAIAPPAEPTPKTVEAVDAPPSFSFATPGELATTSAERDALELELPDPAPDEVATERPTGLVRFLEMMNAPLIAAPEALRALVGKVALLTLFNAAAVLIYVLVFRRHSH